MFYARRILTKGIATNAQTTMKKQLPTNQHNLGGETVFTITDTNMFIATRPSPHSAVSSLAWIIPAGSRWETTEQAGYATALKHALFTVQCFGHSFRVEQ